MVALLGSPRPRTNSAGDRVDQMCQLILGPFFFGSLQFQCVSRQTFRRLLSNEERLPCYDDFLIFTDRCRVDHDRQLHRSVKCPASSFIITPFAPEV